MTFKIFYTIVNREIKHPNISLTLYTPMNKTNDINTSFGYKKDFIKNGNEK